MSLSPVRPDHPPAAPPCRPGDGATPASRRAPRCPLHHLLGIGFAALILALALGSLEALAAAPGNDECLGCHGDKGFTGEVGGRTISLFVDAAHLKASVHGALQCTSCHTGATAIPHPEKLPPVSCAACHGEAAAAFRRSLHGRPGGPALECQACHGAHDIQPAARLGYAPCRECHDSTVAAYLSSVHGRAATGGIKEAPGCGDCHGKMHGLLGQADLQSPTSHRNIAATCGRCHADRTLMERLRIPIPEAYQLYEKSVHSRAVREGLPAATCNNCHRSHDILPATDPRSSINRQHIPETCGQCHRQEATQYLESIHGTAMRHGVTDAPVCVDCHGEHLVRATRDPASPVSPTQVSQTCASCHGVARITQRYDLPSNRVETYYNTFHGLASRGGSTVAANCASCHGDHLILPSDDPRSSINPARLPETCGRCHPGASANFTKGPIHLSPSERQRPILYYARQFYLTLILLIIGGMLVHNGLDYARKLRRDYRRRGGGAGTSEGREVGGRAEGPPRWVTRMTLAERWQHGLLLASFFVLVYTGFALKFPETWLYRWLVNLEHGYALRAWIHRGAGVLLILAGLWHLAYLPTRRGRAYLWAMLPTYQDAKDAVLNLLYLVGLRTESPRFDRFGYIEKAEYWALIWGSGVMISTGLMLWFVNLTLRVFPLWIVDLLTLIHYYEAWLATLAILIWHLYFVIFNPDVYPMNWSWVSGRISEESLRQEHPREYERLLASGQVDLFADETASPAPPDGPSPSPGGERRP